MMCLKSMRPNRRNGGMPLFVLFGNRMSAG